MELFKVVLEGYCRCPDSHDLSECHHLYDLGRHEAAHGCQKSCPSYKFNRLNFDSEKISVTTPLDHLNTQSDRPDPNQFPNMVSSIQNVRLERQSGIFQIGPRSSVVASPMSELSRHLHHFRGKTSSFSPYSCCMHRCLASYLRSG